MIAKGTLKLDPTTALEIYDRLTTARKTYHAENIPPNEWEMTPDTLANEYDLDVRTVSRLVSAGREHHEKALRRRLRAYSEAYHLAPDGMTAAQLDFAMYELQNWIDDGGSYKTAFNTRIGRGFRSVSHMRRVYRTWEIETYERDGRDDERQEEARAS